MYAIFHSISDQPMPLHFAGAVAFLAESTDTMEQCQARGDLVHQIIPATNNQA